MNQHNTNIFHFHSYLMIISWYNPKEQRKRKKWHDISSLIPCMYAPPHKNKSESNSPNQTCICYQFPPSINTFINRDSTNWINTLCTLTNLRTRTNFVDARPPLNFKQRRMKKWQNINTEVSTKNRSVKSHFQKSRYLGSEKPGWPKNRTKISPKKKTKSERKKCPVVRPKALQMDNFSVLTEGKTYKGCDTRRKN